MALASSSLYQLRYKPEAVFGLPVTATKCYALRNTGESLKYSQSTEKSNEIRSDRQRTDSIITDASMAGGVNVELSYGEYDPLFEATLQGTWTVFGTNGVSAVIPTSATFAAGTLTAGAATSGINIFTNLVAGQWVKISGSTIPGQNIIAQVSTTIAPTATLLTFEGTPFTGLTGNGGAAVTISASQLKNGVVQRQFTIEKYFSDISQTLTSTGMTPNKLSLALENSILKGSFDFLGKTSTLQAGSLLHATVEPSTAFTVMNGVNNVSNILEGGALLAGTFIQKFTMDLANNLRDQKAIGNLGAVGIASGSVDLTGTLDIYFANGTLYNKFINNTASSLSFRVNDSAGNGYIITFPFVKYSDGAITAGSINTDVMVNMTYEAMRDPVTGYTILIDRVGAAVTPIV
jgi:hypothetical protein